MKTSPIDDATIRDVLRLLAAAPRGSALELVAVLLEPYGELPWVLWLALAPLEDKNVDVGDAWRELMDRRLPQAPKALQRLLEALKTAQASAWSPNEVRWAERGRSQLRPLANALATYATEWQPLVAQSSYYTRIYGHLICGLWERYRIAISPAVWEPIVEQSDTLPETIYNYAQHCQKQGEYAKAVALYKRYLKQCPAHFPPAVPVSGYMSSKPWYYPPNTSGAWTALALLHQQQFPEAAEVERLFLHAIGLQPNYYRAPYWAYSRYLEERRGPSAYTTRLKQRHLDVTQAATHLHQLPNNVLFHRALEVAQASWVHCHNKEEAQTYFALAHTHINAYRYPKRLKRLFYSLFQYQLYDVVLHLCEQPPFLPARNKTLRTRIQTAYAYYEAKALELKIKEVLLTHRDYWQAQHLVKRWMAVHPQSRAAQACAERIRAALPY